jgi:hypothetical protein
MSDLSQPDEVAEGVIPPDNSRVVRWAGPVFAICALALIPWIAYLWGSLPDRQVSHHYNTAWVGFDVFEVLALAATAYCAFRRSGYLAVTAACAATLLIVDAWFDVLTSPRSERWQSIVLAVLIELPLAFVCGWLAYHAEHVEEKRIHLLLAHRFWRR